MSRNDRDPPGTNRWATQDDTLTADHSAKLAPENNPFMVERRLVALGWHNPNELSRATDSFGLRLEDFRDRLCGVTVGYLRSCGEQGRVPSLDEAIGVLRRFNVPSGGGELKRILADTKTSPDDSIVDLAQEIQAAASDRAIEDARFVTREAIKITFHALQCTRCRRCAQVKERSSVSRADDGMPAEAASRTPMLRGRIVV